MLFSSLTFIIGFLPLTLLIYHYYPALNVKNYFLFFASIVFYAWGEPKFVFVMLFSILINYRVGLWVSNTNFSTIQRKALLALGITANLGILFIFKYLYLAEKTLNNLFSVFSFSALHFNMYEIILPIGISFYTFQSISYLVDSYKTPLIVEKNLLKLGLYISFFPQLIAGPIVRYHDINTQINMRRHSLDLFALGIKRFIIGLGKKVLIANTMAEFADNILAFSPDMIPSAYLMLCICAYTLQIYYDFSGYSDMAIGLAKMFGFNICENFNYPYISKSITEFWHRWHISLTTWFKDYLYIPLGGNRKGKTRTVINLFIVFFITGLWHGAEYHFIFWGLAHGMFLFIEKFWGKRIAGIIKNNPIRNFLGHIYGVVTVTFLWIFFRLGLKPAYKLLQALFNTHRDATVIKGLAGLYGDAKFFLFFALGIIFSFPWWRKLSFIKAIPCPIEFTVLFLMLLLCMAMLAGNTYNPFIYFKF